MGFLAINKRTWTDVEHEDPEINTRIKKLRWAQMPWGKKRALLAEAEMEEEQQQQQKQQKQQQERNGGAVGEEADWEDEDEDDDEEEDSEIAPPSAVPLRNRVNADFSGWTKEAKAQRANVQRRLARARRMAGGPTRAYERRGGMTEEEKRAKKREIDDRSFVKRSAEKKALAAASGSRVRPA